MKPPKPAKLEPSRNLIQRRDAEIAEISAEKTKPGGVKAEIHALALGGSVDNGGTKRSDFAELVLGLLCASLCVLCVSALNSLLPVEQVSP
jgi:hypothetical protein